MDTLVTETSAKAAAQRWIADFAAALDSRNPTRIATLFAKESFWRDILAFDWDLRMMTGAKAITERIVPLIATTAPRDFQLAKDRAAPRTVTRAGTETIEVMFTF